MASGYRTAICSVVGFGGVFAVFATRFEANDATVRDRDESSLSLSLSLFLHRGDWWCRNGVVLVAVSIPELKACLPTGALQPP